MEEEDIQSLARQLAISMYHLQKEPTTADFLRLKHAELSKTTSKTSQLDAAKQAFQTSLDSFIQVKECPFIQSHIWNSLNPPF
jgi:hypothetical protein